MIMYDFHSLYYPKLKNSLSKRLTIRWELFKVRILHFYICFCFFTQESRIPISFGSAQSGSPAACSVGNGLRQNCTVTPPPRRHSLGKVSQAVCEERTPTPLEKQDHQTSDIRAQIAKIEQFLSSDSFRPQKRRKVDDAEHFKCFD